MTRRAYIKCPLVAALAAKNHGFKFVTNSDNLLISDEHIYEDAASYWEYDKVKRYLHPKSLPLLGPIVGDLVSVISNGGSETVGFVDEDGTIVYDFDNRDDVGWQAEDVTQILRRNGKPFPTIEYEDA